MSYLEYKVRTFVIKTANKKLLHKEIKTSEDIRVRHTARRSKHLLFHIIMQHVIFVNNKLTNIHI